MPNMMHVRRGNCVAAKNDVCIWLKDLDEYIEKTHHASLGKKTLEGYSLAGLATKKAKRDTCLRGVDDPDTDPNRGANNIVFDASNRMVGRMS